MTDVTHEVADLTSLGVDRVRLGRLADAVQADIDAGRCDGVALRVMRHGQVVVDLQAGYADRVAGRPVTTDTVFGTQSVGKQFIHTLILSYVERGLLALHQPVADVFPEFGVRGKQGITLEHVLTHTSGLMSAVPEIDDLGNQASLAAHAAESLLESQPGSRVRYSTICGCAVLAEMMLRVNGQGRSLTRLVEDELFAPLGMVDSSMGLRPDLAERFAPLRACFTGTGLFSAEGIAAIGALLNVPGTELASGGYVTTIGDLSRFAEMLRRRGELDGSRILSPAMIDLATRNYTGEMSNSLFDYTLTDRGWAPFPAYLGLGFFLRGERITPGFIATLASPRSFGGFGAGSTCFWVDPARDVSFAMLTTGLMEESRHIERSRRYGDLFLSAIG